MTSYFDPHDVSNTIEIWSSGFTSLQIVIKLLASLQIHPSKVAALQKGKDARDGVLLVLEYQEDLEKVRSKPFYITDKKN
jgi:hypothetical protein